jgi:hypothetical protein
MAGQTMAKVLKTSLELSNNAFDIINGVANFVKSHNLSSFTSELNNRKLLSDDDGFPTWASENQRKLLVSPESVKPNVVLAQDGSGQIKTLTEALKLVPIKNKAPFCYSCIRLVSIISMLLRINIRTMLTLLVMVLQRPDLLATKTMLIVFRHT